MSIDPEYIASLFLIRREPIKMNQLRDLEDGGLFEEVSRRLSNVGMALCRNDEIKVYYLKRKEIYNEEEEFPEGEIHRKDIAATTLLLWFELIYKFDLQEKESASIPSKLLSQPPLFGSEEAAYQEINEEEEEDLTFYGSIEIDRTDFVNKYQTKFPSRDYLEKQILGYLRNKRFISLKRGKIRAGPSLRCYVDSDQVREKLGEETIRYISQLGE